MTLPSRWTIRVEPRRFAGWNYLVTYDGKEMFSGMTFRWRKAVNLARQRMSDPVFRGTGTECAVFVYGRNRRSIPLSKEQVNGPPTTRFAPGCAGESS